LLLLAPSEFKQVKLALQTSLCAQRLLSVRGLSHNLNPKIDGCAAASLYTTHINQKERERAESVSQNTDTAQTLSYLSSDALGHLLVLGAHVADNLCWNKERGILFRFVLYSV